MGPAAIGALGGIASSLLGGIFGSSAQSSANKTNIMLQREQRDWEERMSNTSWQRGTKDMLAAGINPMLGVSQGGASTPNVSAATVQPVDAMGKGVSTAVDKAFAAASTQKMIYEAAIAKEKAAQERQNTEDMNQERGLTGGPETFYRNKWNVMLKGESEAERAKIERDTAEISNRIRATDERIRQVELEVATQVQGYQVASAKAAAEIADKQVTMQEVQIILAKLDIPEKQAIAKWFAAVGAGSPATKAVMSIGQWIKFIMSGK